MKKAIFFALDSFIALVFFIVILTFVYSFFLSSHSLQQQFYLSEDLLNILSNIDIDELDTSAYPNIQTLPVENQKFTLIEQIASFEEQDLDPTSDCGVNFNSNCARIFIDDITSPNLYPVQYDFDVEILTPIYTEKQSEIDLAKALVTRRKFVPGS